MKPEHLTQAQQLFLGMNITVDGHEFLGSYIGTPEATEQFVNGKIDKWSKDIDALVEIAHSEPQLRFR